MNLSTFAHRLAPFARQTARKQDPAVAEKDAINRALGTAKGISEVLMVVRNLPLSLGNRAFKEELNLQRFIRQLDVRLPSEQDYAAVEKSVRCIDRDLEGMEKILCLEQGKPGSRNHSDYVHILNSRKQGIPLKTLMRTK